MLQQIIDNFEKECEKNPDDMMKRVVCNHTVEKLKSAPEEVLKNIVDSKRSLSGAIQRMKSEAEKHKTGGYAVLSDEQGFAITDEYFGIAGEALQQPEQKPEQKPVSLFDMI